MTKSVYRILIATFFLAALAPVASYAQIEGRIEAKVPFKFYAENTLLPAGNYTIETSADDMSTLLLRSTNDRVEVLVQAEQTEATTVPNEPSLMFSKVGDKDFLSNVWVGGQRIGYVLPESRLERQLEQGGTHKNSHSVKAHHRKR